MKQQSPSANSVISKELYYQLLGVTEAASIACLPYIGGGKRNEADQAAVNAMRNAFNHLPISGVVVIGEGERDQAPMLYIGEEVGLGGAKLDIAVDPLEGTNLCATATNGAISVLAVGEKGSLLNAPDVYMEKIAIGFDVPNGIVDLDNSVEENIHNLANFKGCDIAEILVTILERDRHIKLVEEVRATGAKVRLISDGDIMACLATCYDTHGEDMYLGTGAAPEGVIAASAVKNLGGFMQGRLVYKNDAERERAKKMGIKNLDQKFTHNDLVQKESVFVASFVTDGVLPGVMQLEEGIMVNSIIIHPNGEINIENIVKNVI